jgi:hypothetical protein
MFRSKLTLPFSLVILAPLSFSCGDDTSSNTPDAGGTCTTTTTSGMGVLQDFCAPEDPGGNGILMTASGEDLALSGYAFPPATPDDFALVDGWEIRFDRVLSTFDHVTLSDDPDKSPTDQSQTGGVVAEVDGPFAVDLHKGGSVVGKGGGDERAAPFAALTGQNKKGNAAFDPTVRYAFGFEIIKATTTAKNVNLDAADLADYQEMVTKGYTTFLVGTATFKGTGCTSTIPAYDFTKIPTTIKFRFGYVAPTTYINAQNPDNDPAAALPNEEHQRGLHTVQNQSTIAQATFHIDHILWESFVHDSPAHFDAFAAKYAGMTTTPTAKLEDFKGFAFKPFVDALGQPFPWRSCLADYTPPTGGAMTFDTLGVPVNPSGDPATSIRDFYDYNTYNHSTFGHLNSDGLAFVKRTYPSPP